MRNVAKLQENLTLQQFKVIDLGVNGNPICDFLLVIKIENCWFYHPSLVWRPRSGGTP